MWYYNTGVTVELGELVESGFPLFDFEYPVPRKTLVYNGKTCDVDFDKARLEQKILNRYFFRQIGQETPARFKHYLKARMNEIMPYFVQLYEFDAKFRNIDDPLESYNLKETFEQATSGNEITTGTQAGTTSSQTNTESSDERSFDETRSGSESKSGENDERFLDTPQGQETTIDSYLTNMTRRSSSESGENSATAAITENVSNTGSNTTTGSTENTAEQNVTGSESVTHTLERRGNIGVQPLGTEVEDIRRAFINIDEQVVDALNNLFLLIY